MDYLDFDLEITRRRKGAYTAKVVDSPAGQAEAEFKRPFSDLELENFVLKIGRTRTGVRRINSPEMQAAEDFGKKLFEAVFRDSVRECLTSCLHQINRDEIPGLRVKLRLVNVPELANLPWEYLYHPTLRRFIAISTQTPLVRYTDLPRPVKSLTVDPPLRLLVVAPDPTDYPRLNIVGEKSKMAEALRDLERRGLMAVEWLSKATLSALQQRLRMSDQPIHLLHFIGHGGWDEQAQDGLLVFEDDRGDGRKIPADYLATILHDHRSLRLVVLNACEGARSSTTDPFAGVAGTLVHQGIPAVLAMQFEITDRAAIILSQEFYQSLAEGYSAEAALAEARKAIFASGNDVEWGTPVLYLRAADGFLFNLRRGQSAIDAEKVERDERERLVREQAEAERIAREQAEQARLAFEKAEAERLAKQQAEAVRIARERAEAQRLAKEKEENDRLAREKAEAERLAREKDEDEQFAKQKAEEDRLAHEKAESERLAKQKAEEESIAREKAEVEQLAGQKVEADTMQRVGTNAIIPLKSEPKRKGSNLIWVWVLAFWAIVLFLCVGLVIRGNELVATIFFPTSTAQLQILKGHTNDVRSIAFSPDGKMLASGSLDNTVKLWDVSSGQQLQTLHEQEPGVGFSPDGKLLAFVGEEVKIWDIDSGQPVRTIKGTASDFAIAFSPDGKFLATTGLDSTVKLRDVNSGQLRQTLLGHTDYVVSIAFSLDGQMIASGGADKTVKLWDVNSGQLLQTLDESSSWVSSIAFSPDGNLLATGDWGLMVKLWDVASGQLLQTLAGHTAYVESVAFSPDGQKLVSGGNDKMVRLWNVASGKLLETFVGHTDFVWCVSFSPDGQMVASGSSDDTIRLWNVSIP